MALGCYLLHLIKQICMLKKNSKNSHLDSGMSLRTLLSRAIMKLYNIPVTLKLFEKLLTKLDSSKAYGLDCIPVVVLKN